MIVNINDVRTTLSEALANLDLSPAYDEVMVEVAGRVRDSGSIGKADIGALVLWKRMQANTRWARDLSNTPDIEVRQTTAEAVQAVCDLNTPVVEAARAGRRALSTLPGCHHGDALASALLLAAAPERMAVYDSRAHTALHKLGVTLINGPDRYSRYIAIIEQIRYGHPDGWSARTTDLALYAHGK